MADLSKWVDPKHYGKPYYTLIIHFADEESARKFVDEHKDIFFNIRSFGHFESMYVVTRLLKDEVDQVSLDSLKNNPKLVSIIFRAIE